jgi:hypothetical protein
MGKLTKTELINKIREDAESMLKICNEAEGDEKLTAEELEKRVSKTYFAHEVLRGFGEK